VSSAPFSNPDTPLHLPPASVDAFSLETPSPDIHDAKLGTDTAMTADDTPDTDMTTTTLIPTTNASPSATAAVTRPSSSCNVPNHTHSLQRLPSPNWADTVDDDDAGDDASTVLADPDVPLKDYSIQAQFHLPKQPEPSHIPFFKDLATEMMRLDPFFKIHAYDRSNTSELWPLACTDDIPTDDTTVQSYFVHSKFNQQCTSVPTIFRVTSQYSHVEWHVSTLHPYQTTQT
jgi:hypothetical protein